MPSLALRGRNARNARRTTCFTVSGGLDFTMGNYLDKHSRSLRRHERRPSLTRTPPRQSWGRGPSPLGVAANTGPSVDVSFTASCAAPTGRVPGLRGASSSPVHRALVLVLGTNIAVLLDCSKSSRQCSLPYLLTYLLASGDQVIRENPASRGTETSAESLVGPPWRMESNAAGPQQSRTRLASYDACSASGRRPRWTPPARQSRAVPVPIRLASR